MEKNALLLNADFRPISLISWKDAMIFMLDGTARAEAFYDEEIHSASQTWKLPSVLVLNKYVKSRTMVKFSRRNVYLRDNYCCQYCTKSFHGKDLTLDHVIPKSRGGRKTFLNIVSACLDCNAKKKDRTPAEANMPLLKTPMVPSPRLLLERTVGDVTPWSEWLPNY